MRYSKMIFAALSLALFLVLGGGLADAQVFEVGLTGSEACGDVADVAIVKFKETTFAFGDPAFGSLTLCNTVDCDDEVIDLTVTVFFSNAKGTTFVFVGDAIDFDGAGSYLVIQGKGVFNIKDDVAKNFLGTFVRNDVGTDGCFATGNFKSGKRRLDLE
jgi:hypothetical protein